MTNSDGNAITAERSADDVDLEQVGEHYEDMTEKGKHASGERAITP